MTKNRLIIFKFILLSFYLCIIFIFSCVEVPPQEKIHGVWRGEAKGAELVFRFDNDETCVLSFEDTASGSIEILEGTFEIDFSKNPIPLTIKNIPQFNRPLYTIVEFIGNDSMRIAYFSPRWRLRPIAFCRTNTMVLKYFDNAHRLKN